MKFAAIVISEILLKEVKLYRNSGTEKKNPAELRFVAEHFKTKNVHEQIPIAESYICFFLSFDCL